MGGGRGIWSGVGSTPRHQSDEHFHGDGCHGDRVSQFTHFPMSSTLPVKSLFAVNVFAMRLAAQETRERSAEVKGQYQHVLHADASSSDGGPRQLPCIVHMRGRCCSEGSWRPCAQVRQLKH